MSTTPQTRATEAPGDAALPDRCRRCGLPDTGSPACPRCSMPWISGAAAVTDVLPSGVRAAPRSRQAAAYALDLVPLVALVGVAATLSPRWVPWVVALLTVAYAGASAAALAVTGRTLGRRLLALRSVDAEIGEPVGIRRLLGRVTRGARPGLFPADVRAGVDPLELPLPAPVDLRARRRAARRDDPTTTSMTETERALLAYGALLRPPHARAAEPGGKVGLLLSNGQRHDVARILLLGRNPVDTAGEGATLVSWPDLSRRLAKTHLRAEWTGALLWVTGLNPGSGTFLVGPDGVRRPLEPGVRTTAPIGTTIECAGRNVRVVRGG